MDEEAAMKEELDELAMTLGCRLLAIEQRRCRALLTQAVGHHAAKVREGERGGRKGGGRTRGGKTERGMPLSVQQLAACKGNELELSNNAWSCPHHSCSGRYALHDANTGIGESSMMVPVLGALSFHSVLPFLYFIHN